MALVPELLQLANVELRRTNVEAIEWGVLQRVSGQRKGRNLPQVRLKSKWSCRRRQLYTHLAAAAGLVNKVRSLIDE